ncbi:hypothetical protein EXIGLDRAFT_736244 [Exidia glandulosa HHB12029]|uniref:Uncharacterized protein n=1 Tax=Exidia glandulosa HHB12029 TaxID=1314781 RepID=A0A166N9F6_EXIGL|nr:hypothetical protein EXIGLDRAFT_736244 [Exidia glandulosa HHB12029]
MGKQVGRLPVAVAPYFELVTVKDFVPPRPVPASLVPKPVQPAITASGDSSFAGSSRNLVNTPLAKDLDVLAFYSRDMPIPTPAVIFPFLDDSEDQGSFQTLDDIDLFLWNKRQKKGGSTEDSVAKEGSSIPKKKARSERAIVLPLPKKIDIM